MAAKNRPSEAISALMKLWHRSLHCIPASRNYYVAGDVPVTGFTKRENILPVWAKGQHRCHLIAQSTARTMPRDGAAIFGYLIGRRCVIRGRQRDLRPRYLAL
jgi:hypothetical protein